MGEKKSDRYVATVKGRLDRDVLPVLWGIKIDQLKQPKMVEIVTGIQDERGRSTGRMSRASPSGGQPRRRQFTTRRLCANSRIAEGVCNGEFDRNSLVTAYKSHRLDAAKSGAAPFAAPVILHMHFPTSRHHSWKCDASPTGVSK
jgi:hypothetical protein